MKIKNGLVALALGLAACSPCNKDCSAQHIEQEENVLFHECEEVLDTGVQGSVAWISCKDKEENILFYRAFDWRRVDNGYKAVLKKLMPEAKNNL